jgi:hypothetical protein
MKQHFIICFNRTVQKEYFTTEYTEFHGEEAKIKYNSVFLRVLCGLFLTYWTSLKERLA